MATSNSWTSLLTRPASSWECLSWTADNVRLSLLPNVCRMGRLAIVGIFMRIAELVVCIAIFAVDEFSMEFEARTMRTLAFILIVFGNQVTYANRQHRRLGPLAPISGSLCLGHLYSVASTNVSY